MGPRQRARLAGRQLVSTLERSGLSEDRIAEAMRIKARLVDYGNRQHCECGCLGYRLLRIFPDRTVYHCPRCGKVLTATPQQIAQGASHKDWCPGSDCCEEGERCAKAAGRRGA